MELAQSRTINAPPGQVWAALNDPAVLKECIPGCESLERASDTEWRAVVALRVGPVQARFNGKVLLADLVPPTGYTLRFEGQGGAAGFASGEARVTLAPDGPASTTLAYQAQAKVGGKLAQLGSRLIDGVAAKLADDFFTRFADRVAVAAAETVAPEPAVAAAVAATPVAPPRGNRVIRYLALVAIAVVLALLYYYRRQ